MRRKARRGGRGHEKGGRRNPVCRRAGQRGRKGHKGKNLIDEQNGAGLPTWQARPVFCYFSCVGISSFRKSAPATCGRSRSPRALRKEPFPRRKGAPDAPHSPFRAPSARSAPSAPFRRTRGKPHVHFFLPSSLRAPRRKYSAVEPFTTFSFASSGVNQRASSISSLSTMSPSSAVTMKLSMSTSFAS